MSTATWWILGMLSFTATAHAAPDKLPDEQIYTRCAACPCGLLGRRAGSVPGFAYSPAMKNFGFIWDEKTLERFLAQPMKTLPGTKMTYAGIPDP